MPLITPQFSSNASSSTPTRNIRPPWVKGPVPSNANNGQQRSEFVPPWRKNLKSVPPPNSKGNVQQQNVPSEGLPSPSVSNSFLEPQTKTSKLQINLKSVKKPDAIATPPPVSRIIPVLIQRSEPISNNSSSDKKFSVTTIPIQLSTQHSSLKEQQQLSAPAVITTPINQSFPSSSNESGKMPQSSGGPPAPPPPPGGLPPPPPPPAAPPKLQKVDQLRKAPKKRPDWAGMMKEIEKGRVLNHVQCNDRSRPIIPKLKSRGKFVFDSEAKPATKSDALHNRLINEILHGVKLKKVQCNDRSKPILSGLRVRRQSSVMEDLGDGGAGLLEPVDELAFLDIDDLRDELQSAKQMLQTEVDSKRNLEKKTRDQKCHIISMEAEIETLKAKLGLIPEEDVSMLARNLEKSDSKTFKHLRKSGSSLWKSPSIVGIKKSKSGLTKDIQLKASPSDANINKMNQEEELMEMNEIEEEIISLKEAVQHAQKQAEEMEAKYKEAMSKLQNVQNNFEDSDQKRKNLEKQVDSLEALQEGKRPIPPLVQTAERTTQTEEQILEKTAALSRQQSTAAGDAAESEEESESDLEVDEETVQKKKHDRELILWENKVKSIKDKQNTSRLERRNLKNLQKKLEAELKEANKRHKKLQKEVDKMAKMLKDVDKEDDEEDDEPEEKDAEETEDEESEEEESDSGSEDEQDDDEESSEEDDESGCYEDRLAVFGKRAKRRENVLMALRKGNYLLRANIDRLKDDLEEARIAYHDLEHELKAVLDET